jgi:hypothetical protein
MDRPYVDREVDDAYTPMNYNVVTLIRQDPAYKKMTFNDVLERIMNHEMNIQEANNIKNLYKGVSTSNKQDIAIKATNKSKKKKAIIESLTEKEEEEEDEDEKEYDEEEMALFIKKFNKFISKRRPFKGDKKERPRSKRLCDNCGKNGNFIAQCPYEKREEDIEKKRCLTKATRKTRNSQRKSLMDKLMLVKNGTQMMRVLSRKVMTWQPSPSRVTLHQRSHSFQTSPCTHASWQRKAKRR